jgi:hypothetical protein
MATSGKDKDKDVNSLKVRVWGVRVSICTSRVLAALMEKNVDYDLTTVDIVKTMDHKAPEFLKLQVRHCDLLRIFLVNFNAVRIVANIFLTTLLRCSAFGRDPSLPRQRCDSLR